LRQKLADPATCRIYVAELAGRPAGQARVDVLEGGIGEISIALSSSARGRRLGSVLVETASATAARDLMLSEIRATVRSDNLPSLKTFLAAGYEVAAGDVNRSLRVFRWRPA
jgi:RimJ/RimL family protein N-acetyltransferase